MDLNKVLSSLTKGGLSKGVLGGAAGGLLAGALLSKSGRKTAKKVAKVGGVAALGALAWSAYSRYRDNQSGQQPEASASEPPVDLLPASAFDNLDDTDEVEAGDDGYIVLRAMIAAAMADGHIDAGEQQRIFAQVNATDLSSADKAALFEEMQHRRSASEIAALVTDQALAVEVYLASVLAIDESAPVSAVYLDELRSSLKLPPALASQVRSEVEALA